MFVQTQYLQTTRALVALVLADLVNFVPAAILGVNAKVKLYKAGPTPTLNSVIADFTESDFAGYADVVLAAVLGPINLPGGEGMHVQVDYLANAVTAPPQTALGVLITDNAGAVLLAAEQFASPVPFAVAGDGLSYDLILAPRSRWGGVPSAA